LQYINIVSCGVPTDFDEHGYMTTELATMLRNTDKPVRLPIESTAELPYIKELLTLIAGSMDKFRENPFLYLEVSPLSPLDFAGLPADAFIELAQ
jgi:trimethylamine:corrinoid methyltransferase-like protein